MTAIMLAAIVPLAAGCAPPAEQLAAGFQNEDPARRIDAAVRAEQAGNKAALPFLVDRLTDSEDDVRFFAGLALVRIAGADMGWRSYDPADKRAEAVQRWRQWLRERASAGGDKAASRPAQDARQLQEATEQ